MMEWLHRKNKANELRKNRIELKRKHNKQNEDRANWECNKSKKKWKRG